MMRPIIIIFLALIISSFAPQSFAEPDSKTAVRKEMLFSSEQLQSRLNDPDLILIHVASSRDQYDAGHIPNAQFINWNEIAVTQNEMPNEMPSHDEIIPLIQRLGIEENKQIVIYDEQSGLQAARLYVLFDYAGLGDQAALLDGHLKNWTNENRALETDVPSVGPSSYIPDFQPNVIIKFDELFEMIEAGAHMPGAHSPIIDARPPKQYSGKEKGQGIKRGGHIPDAVNIFWQDQIKDPEIPLMRSPEELKLLYRDVKAQPGEEVITYCRTGVQAAHAYFTAKYLGYQPRLYDASYYEWSALKQAQVEK